MERARIDDVKEAIEDLPAKQQQNVMLIAKTHGVNKRFVEILKNGDDNSGGIPWTDVIQKYIDDLKDLKE